MTEERCRKFKKLKQMNTFDNYGFDNHKNKEVISNNEVLADRSIQIKAKLKSSYNYLMNLR